jgi:hypothetical protein
MARDGRRVVARDSATAFSRVYDSSIKCKTPKSKKALYDNSAVLMLHCL